MNVREVEPHRLPRRAVLLQRDGRVESQSSEPLPHSFNVAFRCDVRLSTLCLWAQLLPEAVEDRAFLFRRTQWFSKCRA